MQGKQRLRWIDIAKGIGIVSIILGHQGVPLLGFVYMYHLPVFFLLSGYTLKAGPVDAAFLRGKFNRLMTPYFLTGAAVSVMNLVNLVLRERQGSVVAVTQNLAESLRAVFFASGTITECGGASFPRIGAVWFLPALFFALTLARFLLHRFPDRRMAAGIAVVGAALATLSAQYVWLPFSVQAGVYACPFVLAGHYLRQTDWMEKPRPAHLLFGGAVFAVGAVTKLGSEFYMVTTHAANLPVTPVIALVAGYFVLQVSLLLDRVRLLKPAAAVAALAGKYSLEILCLHLFEMNTLGVYYAGILSRLGLPFRQRTVLPLRFCVIAVLLALLLAVRKLGGRLCAKKAPSEGPRDRTVDLLRAGLIVAMIAGHVPLDPTFRAMLYSVHMPAFILLSGYFHRPVTAQNLKSRLWGLVKGLRYYLLFALLFMAAHPPADWPRLALGISYADQLFSGAASVGPVYFFLLLFAVKLIYYLIDLIPQPWIRRGALIGCVAAGVWLGKAGWWLPWSADAALFCVAFYHAGALLRRYRVTEWADAHPWCYFLLSPLWLYMTVKGSLELSVRNYGEDFGLAILGACGGFLLLFLLCRWLTRRLPSWAVTFFGVVGEATAYILILHTLYGGRIYDLLERLLTQPLGWQRTNALLWASAAVVQTLLGTAVYVAVRFLRRKAAGLRKKQLPA